DVVHAQLLAAQAHALGYAAGDDHHLEANVTHELDAQPVLHVVALELHGRARHVAEVDAAVGEHPVDVEADELDAPRERGIDYWRHVSHTCMSCLTNASSSESGSMLGPSLGARCVSQ